MANMWSDSYFPQQMRNITLGRHTSGCKLGGPQTIDLVIGSPVMEMTEKISKLVEGTAYLVNGTAYFIHKTNCFVFNVNVIYFCPGSKHNGEQIFSLQPHGGTSDYQIYC